MDSFPAGKAALLPSEAQLDAVMPIPKVLL